MILTSEAGELEPMNSLLLVVSVREGAIVILYRCYYELQLLNETKKKK
jgi:hypothetical protein